MLQKINFLFTKFSLYYRENEQFQSHFYTMKEQSEKKMEASLMKDNCLRIPNITQNLYLSLFVLEIIAIEFRAF